MRWWGVPEEGLSASRRRPYADYADGAPVGAQFSSHHTHS
jgi:hypothetical protein